MHHSKNNYWAGKEISPISLDERMSITDLVDNVFDGMGYNAKRLAQAMSSFQNNDRWELNCLFDSCRGHDSCGYGWSYHQNDRKRFHRLDLTTGANTYHDMHFAYGLPVHQGDFAADDNELANADVVRIYDVFIDMQRTLIAQDKIVQALTKKALITGSLREIRDSALLQYAWQRSAGTARHPERSFIAAASNMIVRYCTCFCRFICGNGNKLPSDNGLCKIRQNNTRSFDFVDPSPTMDVLKVQPSFSTAWTRTFPEEYLKSEVVFQRTSSSRQALLFAGTWYGMSGENYVIQVTMDRPDTGGLSGATINEGNPGARSQKPEKVMLSHILMQRSVCRSFLPMLLKTAGHER